MQKIVFSLIAISLGICADTTTPITATDVEAVYTNKHVEITEKQETFKHDIGLGFANTSGNTDTTNLNAKYTFQNSTILSERAVNYLFGATGFLNKEGDTTLAEE